MSEPIKEGDTVYVARVDHACADVLLNRVYVFKAYLSPHPGIYCQRCGQRDIATRNEDCHADERGRAIPKRWLKRIPPLSELDEVKRDEEITA